jgi:hypothetical protein
MDELQAQLRADPRIQQLIAQRGGVGSFTDQELRQLGYNVPDGYHYVVGGRAGYGTLMDDKRGFAEKAAPWLAIGMGGVAGAGALGAVPGIAGVGGGTAAGAGAAGTTAGVGGTTAGAAGTTAGTAGAAGVLPSSSLPAAATMGGPAAITSQGVSAGAGGGGILGALGKYGGIAGQIGDIFGKGAAGAAQGRRDDSYAMANAGRVNLDALALDQKRATLRSLLGGLQDASISRPAGSTIPTFQVNGGLRPSALSNKDALMAEMSRPSPTVEMPKPGTGEKVMGGVGMGLGILGALGSLGKQRVTTPPYNPGAGPTIDYRNGFSYPGDPRAK